MAGNVHVTIEGVDNVVQLLRKLPVELKPKAKQVLTQAAIALQKIMVGRTTGGDPLKRRTGQLARSWRINVGADPLAPSVSVMSQGTPYATLHEFGGTVTAKNSKFLTIPLPDNLTGAGVMRQNARQVIDAGGRTFTSKRGNMIIANKDGLPMFVLKKSVTIPARLGFRDEAAKMALKIYDALARMAGDVIKGV